MFEHLDSPEPTTSDSVLRTIFLLRYDSQGDILSSRVAHYCHQIVLFESLQSRLDMAIIPHIIQYEQELRVADACERIKATAEWDVILSCMKTFCTVSARVQETALMYLQFRVSSLQRHENDYLCKAMRLLPLIYNALRQYPEVTSITIYALPILEVLIPRHEPARGLERELYRMAWVYQRDAISLVAKVLATNIQSMNEKIETIVTPFLNELPTITYQTERVSKSSITVLNSRHNPIRILADRLRALTDRVAQRATREQESLTDLQHILYTFGRLSSDSIRASFSLILTLTAHIRQRMAVTVDTCDRGRKGSFAALMDLFLQRSRQALDDIESESAQEYLRILRGEPCHTLEDHYFVSLQRCWLENDEFDASWVGSWDDFDIESARIGNVL